MLRVGRCRAGVRADGLVVRLAVPRGVRQGELDGARVQASLCLIERNGSDCISGARSVDLLVPCSLVDNLLLFDLDPGRARRVRGPVRVGVGVALSTSGEVEDRLVGRSVVVRNRLGLHIHEVRVSAGVGR